ncbi:hypothetical protein PpSQ1_23525 [Pseudomonas putida]|nr:hypothetical protein PpSQ1_23525 [Pseudomonas putida]
MSWWPCSAPLAEDVSGHDVRDRNVGFVFQHYALFRNMSVFDNVAFGLRMNDSLQRMNNPGLVPGFFARGIMGAVLQPWRIFDAF